MNTRKGPPINQGPIGLDTIEIDTIGEILNISMGAAATAISLMLNRQVVITTPSVRVISPAAFEFSRLEPALGIEIEYIKGLHGSNIMIMSVRDADEIVGLLLDGSGDSVSEDELNELRDSAMGEIMNQMMGASSTALASFLNRSINISPPTLFEIAASPDRFSRLRAQEYIVAVAFRFVVEDLFDSEFVTVMPVEFTKELVKSAMNMDAEEPAHPAAKKDASGLDAGTVTGHTQIPAPIDETDYQMNNMPRRAQPPAQQAAPHPRRPAPAPRRSVDVQMLQFGTLDEDEGGRVDNVNLDLVMDIDLNLVVEIGRAKKLVKELISLRQGSVVELDKQAGEPVDILVNGKLIARGDVVVIDDNFGVRITEIVGTVPRS